MPVQVLPHPSERDDMHHPSLPFRQRHFHHDFEHSRIPLLEGRMFRDGPDVQFGVRHLHTLPDEVRVHTKEVANSVVCRPS